MAAVRARAASHLIVVTIVVFVVFEGIAMLLYPGGTWWDRSTQGVRFWQNFLCDLESDVALNGQPNAAGAQFAESAMFVIAGGLFPFWWIVPRLFPRLPRLGRAVRLLGFASLAGVVAVALMPSQRFGALHGMAVVIAGAPGLTAAGMAVTGLVCAEPRPRVAAAIGGTAIAVALVDFVLYARTMLFGGPGPLVLPIAQKVALLLLLTWMLIVARRAPCVTSDGSAVSGIETPPRR